MPAEEEAGGKHHPIQSISEQAFKYWNHPRERVSWYQAVAFCRWLSHKLGFEISLPTEQQWERAARGPDGRLYPFGEIFDPARANTYETGIHQTSAVGIFPDGASSEGVQDLCGNVWEWCLNQYRKPEITTVDVSGARRVLRGGSWPNIRSFARAAYRTHNAPNSRSGSVGFRVVRLAQ
jgi:formylglycine-generating enzyme required for sulfatase activity